MPENYKLIISGFLGGLALCLVLFFIFDGSFKNLLNKNQLTVISGIVDLNGPTQEGETIAVAQRLSGKGDFETFASDLPANNGINFNWSGAEENQNYDLQAYLQKDGQTVASSIIVTVTAPASHEVLQINVPADGAQGKSTISGSLDINGYIPSGSLISINDASSGGTILSGIQAIDKSSWSWSSAQSGKSYQLQAVLKTTSGEVIGRSVTVNAIAPATDEVLLINSAAQPPTPQKSVISGKIDLNGSVPDNSRIVIFQKEAGSNDAKVAVDNIQPKDGVAWSWNQAVSGKQYDLFAVLKTKTSSGDKDIANSGKLTVQAPANNEELTINTNTSLTKPSQPRVDCNGQADNNRYNITVKMDNMTNTSQYWLEIGTQSGGNDTVNTKFGQTDNPEYRTTINNNTTYYARYAYAFCSGCPDKNFSQFSDTLSFSCPRGASPSPGYTGYVCKMGTGCQLTTDPNAPYSFNNEGLKKCQAACQPPSPSPSLPPSPLPSPSGSFSNCNQSCGGDGYQCVIGLECVSGSLIGDSVCRNPNCTEQTDCTCH